jgi:hypothetical protein
MKPRTPSLGLRALLALGLMIGFYGLAIGVAALLVWLPYAELTYMHRIHPKLALGCLAGAAIILCRSCRDGIASRRPARGSCRRGIRSSSP